jgi:hypothetical protein
MKLVQLVLLSLLVGGLSAEAEISFWGNAAHPASGSAWADDSAVTLGLRFTSDVPGVIAGVRFFNSSVNGVQHTGTLWSEGGTNLAQVQFSQETAAGWQQALFKSPVRISPGAVYVISYFAPNGRYSADQYYAWSALTSAPLRVSGQSPGVYSYESGPSFPGQSFASTNYWVDPVFVADAAPPPSLTYTISGLVTGSGATLALSGSSLQSVTAGQDGTFAFPGLTNGSYVVTPAQADYTFSPKSAAIIVNGLSVSNVNFTSAASGTTAHSVSLSWASSISANINGYNVYRANSLAGTFVRLTPSPINGNSYIDQSVAAGQTYVYEATAVDVNNIESAYSNVATFTVPVP